MASIRSRKTGRGKHYQVRVPGIPSKTFTNLADAKLYASESERKKRLGEHYEAPSESFGVYLDAYLERKRSGWRATTYRDRVQLTSYLKALRGLSIRDVGFVAVDDLVAGLAAHHPRVAQKTLALVKAVLKDAQARKQRIDMSVLTLASPRCDTRTARILTHEEMDELASFMPGFIYRIIHVAGLSGLRQGELFSLKESDLFLNEGWLQVQDGKTKSARRRVNLAPEVVALLREQLLAKPHSVFVFPASQGGLMNKDRFGSRYFRPARDAAKLPDVRFHDLRATYASLMIRAGVDIRTIASQLGHADGGALLLKRYGFLYNDAGERAASALSSLLQREAR